ncbi:Uncharacterised protein [Vibrio cholerae]|nr:Uncharacterised protein [Vibrio cholerae]
MLFEITISIMKNVIRYGRDRFELFTYRVVLLGKVR